jgi:hypothetical protein
MNLKIFKSLILKESLVSLLSNGEPISFEKGKITQKDKKKISTALSKLKPYYETLGGLTSDLIEKLEEINVTLTYNNEIWTGTFSGGFSNETNESFLLDYVLNDIKISPTNSKILLSIYKDNSKIKGVYELTCYVT